MASRRRRWARRARRRELRAAIVELTERTRALLREGRTLAGDVADRRLRLEIQVIYALAEAHIDRLLTMDPLAERAKLPRWRMGLVALRRGGRRISLWRAAQRRACRRRGRDAGGVASPSRRRRRAPRNPRSIWRCG